MAHTENNEIIKEARRFAKQEIRPLASDLDLEPDMNAVRVLMGKLQGLDLFTLTLPAEFGGIGYPDVCAALVLDVLASECPGIASICMFHFAACRAMAQVQGGNREQIFRRFTESASKMPLIAGIVLPSKDPDERVRLDDEGNGLKLSGRTGFIGNAGLAGDLMVFAEEADGSISAVIVDASDPYVVINENPELPGLKANPFAVIEFRNAAVDASRILGERRKGMEIMVPARDALMGLTAAVAMGAARAACRKAVEYAGQRYQFGDTIIRHQEIQRMIGRMHQHLQTGTSAYLQLMSGDSPNPFEPFDAALVKTHCTDAALEIALDAIQIHGGYGYMHEYGLEKTMRDIKTLQVIGGGNPTLLVDFIRNRLRPDAPASR